MNTPFWNEILDVFQQSARLDTTSCNLMESELMSRFPSHKAEIAKIFQNFLEARHAQVTDSSAKPEDGSLENTPDQLGCFLGAFQLKRLIGTGGMGKVYLAEQFFPIHREVALKRIKSDLTNSQLIRMFEIERNSMALMDHPAIASIYEAGALENGDPYLVMEYIEGLHFPQYCQQHELSLEARIELFIEVAEGVQHAHQKGVIHRDLKPSNILVKNQDGRHLPKIIDFGLAKLIAGPGVNASRTWNPLMGTPYYMSPEQVTGEGVDIRSDLYAMGLVLYQTLVGQLPFSASNQHSAIILNRILTLKSNPFPTASEVLQQSPRANEFAASMGIKKSRLLKILSYDLDWILAKALASDRNERYGSMQELISDLKRFMKGEPIEARQENHLYLWKKRISRHKTVYTVALFMLFAILSGTTAFAVGWYKAVQARKEADNSRIEALEANRVAKKEASKAEALNGFFKEILLAANPEKGIGYDAKITDALDRAYENLDTHFVKEPEIRVGLLTVIGQTYFEIGKTESAKKVLTESYQVATEQLAADNIEYLKAKFYLGKLMYYCDYAQDKDRIDQQFDELLPQMERLPEMTETLPEFYDQMGALRLKQGRVVESLRYYDLAYRKCKDIYGSQHEKTMESFSAYLYIISTTSRDAEIKKMTKSSLENQLKALQESDSSAVFPYMYLGDIYYRLGEFSKSKYYYTLFKSSLLKKYGKNNYNYMMVLIKIMYVPLAQKQYLETLGYLNEAREHLHSKMPNYEYYLIQMNIVEIQTLMEMGLVKQAAIVLKQTYVILENSVKVDKKMICLLREFDELIQRDAVSKGQSYERKNIQNSLCDLSVYSNFVRIHFNNILGLYNIGFYNEKAERLFREAWTLAEPDTSERYTNAVLLGRTLYELNRWPEAVELLEPLVREALAGKWPDNEYSIYAVFDYGRILEKTKRDPLQYYEAVWKRCKQVLEPGDGRIVEIARIYGQHLLRLGKAAQARELLQEALKSSVASRGESHEWSRQLERELLALQ